MEEQGIVSGSALDEPFHRFDDVGLGRFGVGVFIVVGEEDDVFGGVPEVV
jgi:hypothetical protein